MRNLFIALILIFSSAASGEFVNEEVFVLSWGEDSDQLKISDPAYDDYMGTPEDSLDDYVELGGGPPRRGRVCFDNAVIEYPVWTPENPNGYFYNYLKWVG